MQSGFFIYWITAVILLSYEELTQIPWPAIAVPGFFLLRYLEREFVTGLLA